MNDLQDTEGPRVNEGPQEATEERQLLIDSIRSYVARGWHVFPLHSIERGRCTCKDGASCRSPGKHPRTHNGVNDATNDQAQIDVWLSTYGDSANWGLACGSVSGVFVIDVDAKHGGFESLDEYGEMPETLRAISGGGGRHYFFEYPSDGLPLGNRVRWLPGVDVRSDGGYVVLPPGRHVSGGRYHWQDDGTTAVDPPLNLLESIRSGSTSQGPDGRLDDSASILDGVPEGQRDDVLFRWACRLRRQLEGDADGGRAAITTLILEAARRSEFPERDALAKVDQAFKQDHTDTDPSWRGIQYDRLVEGGTFVLDEPEQIPAIWGQGDDVLWAEGEGLMIAGHQGLGKTTIAQQLVLARIGIKPETFLELPVSSSSGRVLYLAMDRPRQAARSFRRMVREEDRLVMDQRLMVWRGPLPGDPLVKSHLINWVREVCPDADTLVVDSVKDLAPGVSDDAVGSALNSAWQSVIADGIDILLLHHGRKAKDDSKRGYELDTVFGSTWLTSGLGSVITLTGEPGSDEVTLHHVKQPAETVGPLDVRHEHHAGQTILTNGVRLTVEEALALTGSSSVSELAATTGLSEKTVRRRVKAMEEQGLVTRSRGAFTGTGRTQDVIELVRQGQVWS